MFAQIVTPIVLSPCSCRRHLWLRQCPDTSSSRARTPAAAKAGDDGAGKEKKASGKAAFRRKEIAVTGEGGGNRLLSARLSLRCRRIPGQRAHLAGHAPFAQPLLGASQPDQFPGEIRTARRQGDPAGMASWSATCRSPVADHRPPITPVTRSGLMSTSGSCRCRIMS